MDYLAKGPASTDGQSGYFSQTQRTLTVELVPSGIYLDEDLGVMGHLMAYFDPKEWDVKQEGLIYTDAQFEKDVRDLLKNAGLQHYEDICYSEQGMQGDDFVDFDLGPDLAEELYVKGFVERQFYLISGSASTDGRSGGHTQTQKTIGVSLEANTCVSPEKKVVGSLHAIFDPMEWYVKQEGLICMDKQFWEDIRDMLKQAGIQHYEDFSYSEPEKQNAVFVHFDLGDALAQELFDKGLEELKKIPKS
ncbi:hypothetical protein AAG747_27525 [Rapidithrix thailandica]|uniref:Uncharacterized protein n=1 Tax=Rapidithrix thailandica TaxID=413964 RepID=A0AAW9S3F6_9BACT